MRNNTEEVKKNFLKKIKMILSIIMLSLIVVPCITSCIHGNNPNKPADKVEEEGGDPPKVPTDPVPGMTSDQMIEELVSRKLGKINQDTYFYTFDIDSESFKNDLEKYMNPFNLGRKKGDDTKKLYLISSAYKSNSGYCANGGLYETIAGLDTRIKELLKPDDPLTSAYIPEGSYGFNTIAESLEWRWNLVKLESRGRRFFYEQCYPWLTFVNFHGSHEPGVVKPEGMYRVAFGGTDYISKKTNNGDVELYFINIQGLSYFEWWITFINKNDKRQIYSFHVGPYSTIASSNSKYPYPPGDDAEYAEDDKVNSMEENYKRSAFHMLKLSTLVRLSFGREVNNLVDGLITDSLVGDLPKKLQYEAFKANPSQNLNDDDAKKLAKDKIVDCIRINPFGKDFPDLNNWDVYLTFGIFSPIPLVNGGFAGGRSPQYMWHNTVKLTGTDADEFWGKCWN